MSEAKSRADTDREHAMQLAAEFDALWPVHNPFSDGLHDREDMEYRRNRFDAFMRFQQMELMRSISLGLVLLAENSHAVKEAIRSSGDHRLGRR